MDSSFSETVLAIVSEIPEGQTKSYKEVASLAGNPKAARAVGTIMRQNKNLDIPCHRVVRSDGSPGGYNGLRGKSKSELLKEEQKI